MKIEDRVAKLLMYASVGDDENSESAVSMEEAMKLAERMIPMLRIIMADDAIERENASAHVTLAPENLLTHKLIAQLSSESFGADRDEGVEKLAEEWEVAGEDVNVANALFPLVEAQKKYAVHNTLMVLSKDTRIRGDVGKDMGVEAWDYIEFNAHKALNPDFTWSSEKLATMNQKRF